VSLESLVILVIFIALPLLERLMKLVREHQANQPAPSEMPIPQPAPPTRTPRLPSEPEVQSWGPGRRAGRPPGKTPRRRGLAHPPPEPVSAEAASMAAVEEQPVRPELPRRRRGPRLNLTQPASVRAAIVAQTVLGPCRAARPYDGGPDA
jgi:hypothetical protein